MHQIFLMLNNCSEFFMKHLVQKLYNCKVLKLYDSNVFVWNVSKNGTQPLYHCPFKTNAICANGPLRILWKSTASLLSLLSFGYCYKKSEKTSFFLLIFVVQKSVGIYTMQIKSEFSASWLQKLVSQFHQRNFIFLSAFLNLFNRKMTQECLIWKILLKASFKK